MVYYFIIAQDGQRYGPADIDTLVQWTREGRIIGNTTLVERGTERQLFASEITAVAAELRRMSGDSGTGVTVERGSSVSNEMPTMTQPGRPADPAIGALPRIPTAQGVPPPPPGGRVVGGPVRMPYASAQSPGIVQRRVGTRSKVVAGLLGIFLGGLGVHRFYLGYTGVGLLMLLLSFAGGCATAGYGCGFTGLWGLIEGIVCLCGGMKDADGYDLRD